MDQTNCIADPCPLFGLVLVHFIPSSQKVEVLLLLESKPYPTNTFDPCDVMSIKRIDISRLQTLLCLSSLTKKTLPTKSRPGISKSCDIQILLFSSSPQRSPEVIVQPPVPLESKTFPPSVNQMKPSKVESKDSAYVSDGQESAVKKHHHAHQHKEQSERRQSHSNLYFFIYKKQQKEVMSALCSR